jgi:excisionase family DNA binding protein
VAVSVLLRSVSLAEQPENFTYTAAEAARILRLSSQRVRQLLASGELRGVRDEVGHWEVDARSVHELLNERREAFSEALEDLLRLSELEAEVRELRYLLGRAEGRLELAKGTESALRAEQERLLEELARERERADRLKGAQEEADRLREELEAEHSKGFWRRLFGG